MSDRKSKVQELYETLVEMRNALKAAKAEENTVRNEVKSELDRLSKATFRTDPDLRRKMEEEIDVEHTTYQSRVNKAKDVFDQAVATASEQLKSVKKEVEHIYQTKRKSITDRYTDLQHKLREAAHKQLLEAELRGRSAVESRVAKVKEAISAMEKVEEAHFQALEEAKQRREEKVKAGKEKGDAKLVQQQPDGDRGAQ